MLSLLLASAALAAAESTDPEVQDDETVAMENATETVSGSASGISLVLVGSAASGSVRMNLNQLRNKFPAGKYWNHAGNPGAGNSVNNQDGWTNSPCPRHKTVGTSAQTCNGFNPGGGQLSWQCMGYAEKLGYDATGLNPRSQWTTSSSSSSLNNLKAGDIVRFKNDGHSIFITGVNGDTVTYTDCNSDGHCVIRWGATISKSTLRSSFTYTRISPVEIPWGNDVCYCTTDYAGNYLCTSNSTLLIRTGHGTGYGVVGEIPGGATVYVSKADGAWAHVTYGGLSGYSSMAYLSRISDPEPAVIEGEEMASGYSRVLPDGEYLIKLASDTSYFLDLDGTDVPAASGTNVHLYHTDNGYIGACDMWTLSYSDGFYTNEQKGTNLALDLSGGSRQQGANVQGYEGNGTSAQKWAIKSAGNGSYILQAKVSGMAVDVDGGVFSIGTNIQVWSENGSNAQKWVFEPVTYSATLSASSSSVSMTLPNTTSKTVTLTAGGFLPDSITLTADTTNDCCSLAFAQDWNGNSVDLYVTGQRPGSTVITIELLESNTGNLLKSLEIPVTISGVTYTVAYNANGGSGAPSSQTKTWGVDLTLSSVIPTRSNYSFQGWAASSSGNAVYQPGETYAANSGITLYAVWKNVTTYTVAYNANGGSGAPSSQTKTHGVDLTLTSAKPTRSGYTFLGWSLSADSDVVQWYAGSTFTYDTSVTLYAMWGVTISSYNFPDAAFRSYLSGSSIDKNTDGALSKAEINAVTEISVGRKSISSLQGLSFFPNLEELWCEGNQLTSLDVSGNTALKYLYCYSNQLTGLDVSHNTALIYLDCIGNPLGSLNVRSNRQLVTLRCGATGLVTLDVTQNTKLKYLACNGNQLTTLNVSNNTALTELYCGENDLTALNIRNNTALEKLDFFDNEISVLDMSRNSALNYLSCESNRLTSLDFTGTQLVQTNTYTGGSSYEIDSPFDLSTLPGSFDVSRTSNWSGGTISGTVFTAPVGTYTYKYDCGNSASKTFTLVVETSAPVTYTVSYSANGGSGAPSSQTKTYGETLTLSATIPTRTGYTFVGWATSSSAASAQYQPGGGYTANAGVTLYAVWAVKTYTISYNANGGSGAPSSQTKTHNVALTLSGTVPTRSGYTFQGWATSSTATSATYQPGGSYTANSGATLYAVWTQPYGTVTYNANGGTGAPSSQTTPCTIPGTVPTRTGYTFLGWAASSSATSASYQAGDTISSNASMTLYAVWRIDTYAVVYNANGGTGAPATQTKTYNVALTLSSQTPTRSGYVFQGWATSSSATSAQYSPGSSYTVNAGVTLYAVWASGNTYYIAYSPNGGSGAPASQTKYHDVPLTLSSTVPTRTGYTFLGWATTSYATTAQYQPGGTYTANAAATLYAVWTKATYTITYNANGGTGAPSPQTKTHGVNLTLSSVIPTRSGYTFLGWATYQSATAPQYYDGGLYTVDAGATMYAVWTNRTYTISYNANGGTGAPASQTKAEDLYITLSSTVPTRSGYTFQGWATSSSSTTVQYQPGDRYTANASVTLYAVWSGTPVTSITFSSPMVEVDAGKTLQLQVTVSPSNASDKSLTWSSSDTAVARVSQSGVVTGVSAGTAAITVTNAASGKSAYCIVTVKAVTQRVVQLPAYLTAIESEAFAGNTQITAVKCGSRLTTIGNKAFSGCTGLADIWLPDTVTTIASDAFEGCSGITFHCPDKSFAWYYAMAYGYGVNTAN